MRASAARRRRPSRCSSVQLASGPGSSSAGSPRNLLSTNAGEPLGGSRRARAPTCRRGGRTRRRGRCRRRGGRAASACVEHAVVDEVGQVDLGRAAGALDDDELVLARSASNAALIAGHRCGAAVAPRHRRRGRAGRRPCDDDLAAGVALGLEQHRVHPHVAARRPRPGPGATGRRRSRRRRRRGRCSTCSGP